MKRLLLIFLALAPGIALLAWLGFRGDDGAGRWQPLPGGGEVRVRGVTSGTLHEMENDDRSLLERTRDWWKGPRLKGGPSPFALRKARIEGPRSLYVWVETKGSPPRGPWIGRTSLHLLDGEIIPIAGARRWMRPDGSALGAVCFSGVPARAPTLRFVMKVNGEEIAFDLPNPAIRQPLPADEESRRKRIAPDFNVEMPVIPVPSDFAGEMKPTPDFPIAAPK